MANAKGIIKHLGLSWVEVENRENNKDYSTLVQVRFELDDNAMEYLKSYKFDYDLLKKLAKGK